MWDISKTVDRFYPNMHEYITGNYDLLLAVQRLLFWFFGDFRCGVPLFIVILVMYKYKNR